MPTNRETLKAYFQKGAKPTAEQFAALIDSGLNQADDGVSLANRAMAVSGPVTVGGALTAPSLKVSQLSVESGAATFKAGISVNGTVTAGAINASSLSVAGNVSFSSGVSGLTVNPVRPSAPPTVPGLGQYGPGIQEESRVPAESNRIAFALTVNGPSKTTGLASFSGGVLVTDGAVTIQKSPGSQGAGFFGPGAVPVGGIIMWSGAIKDIPEGWVLCDGMNNTPNLVDRFILGAGPNSSPASKGGAAVASVLLNVENIPQHKHGYEDNYFKVGPSDWKGGGDKGPWATGTTAKMDTATKVFPEKPAVPFDVPTMPPYYVLAFIMRINL